MRPPKPLLFKRTIAYIAHLHFPPVAIEDTKSYITVSLNNCNRRFCITYTCWVCSGLKRFPAVTATSKHSSSTAERGQLFPHGSNRKLGFLPLLPRSAFINFGRPESQVVGP